jgi:hypothetical protein
MTPWSLGCKRASRLEESKEQKYFPTTVQIDEGFAVQLSRNGKNLLFSGNIISQRDRKSGKSNA